MRQRGRRPVVGSRAIRAVLIGGLLIIVAGFAVPAVRGGATQVRTEATTIPVPDAPDSSATLTLDTNLYLPQRTPAPAVLLAHGFGGNKDSVEGQARQLAADGFVVLAYSARGFGASTGQIWLNDPDREVADARALVSWLAARPEVAQDGPGDPHVGVAGGSYGGALALGLGATDPRVDAVAAGITWNDLGTALFPNYAVPVTGAAPAITTPAGVVEGSDGVLKRQWAATFFAAGNQLPPAGAEGTATPGCGRFAPPICQAYIASAVSGRPTPELLALLRSHSPVANAGAITAPTLLIQGERDSLFGLDQADATARAIAGAGGNVQVRWFNGGHDGDSNRADGAIRSFLDRTLRGEPPDSPGFDFALPGAVNEQGEVPSRRMTAPSYPGLTPNSPDTPHTVVELSDGARDQPIARPPGAAPASISGLPGLGALAATPAAGALLTRDPPGQAATFRSAPLPRAVTVTGSATVDLRVTSTAGPGETVRFAKLYDVSSSGRRTLPGTSVSALRLPDGAGPGAPVDVRVSLPAIGYQFAEGHRIELVVASTDQAYAVPAAPAQFVVSLPDDRMRMPSVPATATSRTIPVAPLIGIGALALGTAGLAGIARFRRTRRRPDVDPALTEVPLVVDNLGKTYRNGFRAVRSVSFRVEPGQVLGLLGPNGAGKTTTLRMVLGLINPTRGTARVFGRRITPGAPVLTRVGAFIEGPGLLPQLSGADNLRLFWQATGRPADQAALDEVVRIADLGPALDRKVGSYSQGMRQRLAIAQAMLGLPDLLILDEPTNGLDPPQIRRMREVLRAYAQDGRTVLVSSHLLAEVEQTCTDVVVMNRGAVISAGPVHELVAAGGPTEFRVDDRTRAAAALAGIDGLGSVADAADGSLRIDLRAVPSADVVRTLVEAGVAVRSAAPTSRLEDVFLAMIENRSADDDDR